MTFAKDIKKAKRFEKLLIDFLKDCGYNARLNDEPKNYSFYDIIVDNPPMTFEVKADFMCSLTGNLAIEHHNCKKDEPSGIKVSTADFWCHIIYENKEPIMYFARRLELLQFIEEVEPFKKIIAGGDDNANLYLYKKTAILDEFGGPRPLRKLTVEQAKNLFGDKHEN